MAKALKKYNPDDPWIRWTDMQTQSLLGKKRSSYRAENPRKLRIADIEQKMKAEEPQAAHKGRI